MAVYPINTLKTRVNTYIKENGQQLVTGPILQGILQDLIDSLNALLPKSPVPGTFNAGMLDGTGSITITHNLGSLTPSVTLSDPTGVQMFETNVIMRATGVNTFKFTIISPEPTGNYSYLIKEK